MSNPFGEYEDDEYDNVNENQNQQSNCDQRQQIIINQSLTTTVQENSRTTINDEDSNRNPFGDDDDGDGTLEDSQSANTSRKSTIMNLEDSFDTKLDLGSRVNYPSGHHQQLSGSTYSNRYDFDDDSKSISRQSIASINSSEIATNLIVGNFSIGDGGLQKEGLLCPECLVEFKTITELMKHFEQKHRAQAGSASAGNATQLSDQLQSSLVSNSLSDGAGQMSHQIKGFINKLIKPSQGKSSNEFLSEQNREFGEMDQSGTGGGFSENTTTLSRTTALNPISDWKLFMKQGPHRSHTEWFRSIRESRIERYIFETNKLLIRLDKLLRDYPPLNDLVGRREHEQSVVTWLDDSMVNLCPSCASKFNILTRKKHHCRLCGAVMCTKCSEFIDFEFARNLLAPIGLDGPHNQSIASPVTRPNRSGSMTGTNLTSLAKSGTSLVLSMVGSPIPDHLSSENADKLRVCLDCKSLLTVRKEKIEVAHSKPPIVQLYEQLRENVTEINRLTPLFDKMADSLNCGETTYNLRDANDLKHKLTKLGESCDLISRKIESQGVSKVSSDSGDSPSTVLSISQRQLNLQLAIRRATVSFLRQYLLGLPELPDEQKLEQLRKRHAELIQKRIAYEKELALREQHTFKQIRDSTSGSATPPTNANLQKSQSSGSAVVSIDDGFCPQLSGTELWKNMNEDEMSEILEQDDPMLQQMNIIRSYIRQARQHHRYEEVNMLEDNLHELEIEYYFKQQQQQQPTSITSTVNRTDVLAEEDLDRDPDPDPTTTTTSELSSTQ